MRLARAVLDDPGPIPTPGPLVCVYNRTGGARLLACSHCGELARCTRCGAAASRPRDEEILRCPRCGERRPVVCASCGRLRMKTLRVGVSRLREELSALLGVAVGEVAGPRARGADEPLPVTPVLVGTEAVLHRVRRAAAVAFLDVDLHLLAPRLSATEDTLALLVRAARLVGPRGAGGPWARVQVQSAGARPSGAGGGGPGRAGECAGRGGGRAPRLGPPAVRRVGGGVGVARARVCRRARRTRRRWARARSPCRCPPWVRIASSSGRRHTGRSAICSPLSRDRPAGVSGSRWIPPSSERPARGAGPRGVPVGWGRAEPHHPPVRGPRAQGARP